MDSNHFTLFHDLHNAVATVYPYPVAGVQGRGSVAAADNGRGAQFAGDDGGVGKRRANISGRIAQLPVTFLTSCVK